MANPVNIEQVLRESLDGLGLFEKARKYRIYGIWPRVVGRLAGHAQPRRVDGDVLYVATASSVWSQELSYMSQGILAKLNAALGGSYFREIKFSEHLWEFAANNIRVATARAVPGKEATLGGKRRSQGGSRGSEKDLSGTLQSLKKAAGKNKTFLEAAGFVHCKKCGWMYEGSQKGCPYCRDREESYGYHRAIVILEKTPALSDRQVCDACRIRDPFVAQRARNALESRLLNYLRGQVFRSAGKESGSQETAECAKKLASLRSGIGADKMSHKDFEKALGKRLAPLIPRK